MVRRRSHAAGLGGHSTSTSTPTCASASSPVDWLAAKVRVLEGHTSQLVQQVALLAASPQPASAPPAAAHHPRPDHYDISAGDRDHIIDNGYGDWDQEFFEGHLIIDEFLAQLQAGDLRKNRGFSDNTNTFGEVSGDLSESISADRQENSDFSANTDTSGELGGIHGETTGSKHQHAGFCENAGSRGEVKCDFSNGTGRDVKKLLGVSALGEVSSNYGENTGSSNQSTFDFSEDMGMPSEDGRRDVCKSTGSDSKNNFASSERAGSLGEVNGDISDDTGFNEETATFDDKAAQLSDEIGDDVPLVDIGDIVQIEDKSQGPRRLRRGKKRRAAAKRRSQRLGLA